jgi:hypothetical protein
MTQRTDEEIRHRRNVYLEKSDSYVLPDRWDYYTDEQKNAWRDYRQALRDIPQQEGYPITLTWPQPPDNVNFNVPADDEWPPEWI